MSRQSNCPIKDLLQEQVSESASAYAKATLEMLQVPDVRSEEYTRASKRALKAQAELKYLSGEINLHCQEHGCGGQVLGGKRKNIASTGISVPAPEVQEAL